MEKYFLFLITISAKDLSEVTELTTNIKDSH
jgi:hypothetical protein